MTAPELAARIASLTTPLVADACQQLGRPVRCAPSELAALVRGTPIAGPALPVRHHGSVDVFLEAMDGAARGDVLVIDNEGRRDEACVGDLIALEAASAGVAGLVVWGSVRDSAELVEIGLPVYSIARCPAGPRGQRAPTAATPRDVRLGSLRVTAGDVVFADDDGVVLVDAGEVAAVLDAADDIARRERAQAQRIREGHSLRAQLRFAEYLAQRANDPSLTFREHLRRLGGAVEV